MALRCPPPGPVVVPHVRRPGPSGDDRGVSFTTLIVGLVPMLIVLCGLVVDGAAQASAAREAAVIAAQAARSGADAAAALELTGGDGSGVAASTARRALADKGIHGVVDVAGGRLHVRVDDAVGTVFLGIIGVRTLPVDAEVWAELKSR